MKPSTLIIEITYLSPSKISYVVNSDLTPRTFSYLIPKNSQFPYDQLEEGGRYALVSVKVDETWMWWIAYALDASSVLVDKQLLK